MRLQKQSLVTVNDSRLKFIQCFSDVLDHKICQELISEFEKNKINLIDVKKNGPNFTELNITKNISTYHKTLIDITLESLKTYISNINKYGYFLNLENYSFEDFRIKKYSGGTDDRFDMHYDVFDQFSSKRCLSFLYYLNDNFSGGDTVFYPNYTIRPVKGSVLVFPPYWIYPHEGKKVISGNKYVMSSYLGLY